MEAKSHLKAAKIIARLMDNQWEIAGIKFGLDPILDLIPWVGDVVGALISLYILSIGWKMEISTVDKIHLVWNIILDFILGFVPFIGVIFDLVYKANIRNIAILEKYSHGKFVEGKIVSD